ncbi:MAG: hypothetical protein KME08_07010 [Aphanothece sp. CMT-3BRIN-NPC111]|nr:hypothetical protein [Aphanothece sp. CMT-3BRIN-NPC111]
MNTKILSVIMALPMVLVGAGQSFASGGMGISNVNSSISTMKTAQATPNTLNLLLSTQSAQGVTKENLQQGTEVFKQLDSNLQFGDSELVERRGPKGPGGADPSLQLAPNFQLGDSELVERRGPKGPGGADPSLQLAPMQQLQ